MSPRGAISLWLVCGTVLAGPAPAQQRPTLEVSLSRDTAPAVNVRLTSLLTEQVINALESGFPLYVHYHVALREPGGLFGGRTARDFDFDYVVLHDPVRNTYAIEEAEKRDVVASRDSLRVWVSRVFQFPLEADRGGRYYYQVQIEARTLSDQDVDEAFAWLKGGDNAKAEQPGFFTRAARRVLVRVMPLPSFELEGKSDVFFVRR